MFSRNICNIPWIETAVSPQRFTIWIFLYLQKFDNMTKEENKLHDDAVEMDMSGEQQYAMGGGATFEDVANIVSMFDWFASSTSLHGFSRLVRGVARWRKFTWAAAVTVAITVVVIIISIRWDISSPSHHIGQHIRKKR